jgi:hypothetical protein
MVTANMTRVVNAPAADVVTDLMAAVSHVDAGTICCTQCDAQRLMPAQRWYMTRIRLGEGDHRNVQWQLSPVRLDLRLRHDHLVGLGYGG